MKNTTVVTAMLVVLLGVVSAAATTALLARRVTPERAGTPALAAESELRTALRELQDENRELFERLAALEMRPVPVARQPVGETVPVEDFEALREEVREWMSEREAAAARAGELVRTPQFEDQVAEALQSIRKDETVAWVKQDQERRARALEERVQRMSDWLDLDAYQANEMRTILTQKDEREQEVLRLWEQGAEDELLGQAKRTNQEEHRSAVERVLTPQQWETYNAPSEGEKAID